LAGKAHCVHAQGWKGGGTRMKVGVIIPTRNDRPGFMGNCLRMLRGQTWFEKNGGIQWQFVRIVDWPPSDGEKDITKRYRIGYDELRNSGVDVIFFWEDDDWYSPNYMDVMIGEWKHAGKPDIFGTGYTIYYHLKLGAYFTMHHPDRASAMNTMIIPDLRITWPPDAEPYTDQALWLKIPGQTFIPKGHISIGMKHGIGLSGGGYHADDRLHRFRTPDNGLLKDNLDDESLAFYLSVSQQLKQQDSEHQDKHN
jgi:hypothetical protein